MTAATLAFAGAVAIAAGAAYAYVGARLARRPATSRDARRALSFFALWWLALALNITLVGGTYVAAAAGVLTFEVQLVDAFLQRVLLGVSMVGLMYYLLYLLTGRDLLAPLAVFYGAHFLATTYLMFRADPSGVFVGDWRTDLAYAHAQPAWTPLLALAAIVIPPVAASAAYFRLFFRVEDRLARYRIALVSWSIIGWWAFAVVAGQRAALENGPLQSVHRVLSLLAAFAVLAAYAPPSWVRRRWAASSTSNSRSTSASEL